MYLLSHCFFFFFISVPFNHKSIQQNNVISCCWKYIYTCSPFLRHFFFFLKLWNIIMLDHRNAHKNHFQANTEDIWLYRFLVPQPCPKPNDWEDSLWCYLPLPVVGMPVVICTSQCVLACRQETTWHRRGNWQQTWSGRNNWPLFRNRTILSKPKQPQTNKMNT